MLIKKDSIKNEVKTNKAQKTAAQAEKTLQENSNQSKSLTKNYAPTKTHEQADYYAADKKPHQKTRIVIRYNTGYGNQLYIRGKGANLSWDKGTPLKNTKADEWVWETDTSFSHCEFKILLNDRNYENGENHYLNPGASIVYTPHFYH
jgi:hypothetical protein